MKRRYILLSLLSLFVVFTAPAFAVDEDSDKTTVREERREERKAEVQERLSENRLRVCEGKEKVIQNRTASLNRMAQNMLEKFAAIAQRVQNYYTTTVVPSGKTVSNYDNLVADISAKKALVQTALDNATAHADDFACDSDDPKGQLTQFREDMQRVKAALKDYRTSIKNLIVAVRSVVGESESEGD